MAATSVDTRQQAVPGNPVPRVRLYFIDWLRVVLTVSVIASHALLTYASDGER